MLCICLRCMQTGSYDPCLKFTIFFSFFLLFSGPLNKVSCTTHTFFNDLQIHYVPQANNGLQQSIIYMKWSFPQAAE